MGVKNTAFCDNKLECKREVPLAGPQRVPERWVAMTLTNRIPPGFTNGTAIFCSWECLANWATDVAQGKYDVAPTYKFPLAP